MSRSKQMSVIVYILACLGVVASVFILSACSNQTVRDLEDVPLQEPEKSELYASIDKYPNVNALCIHGVGFASTTRDTSPAALQHIPAWDAANDGWCGK